MYSAKNKPLPIPRSPNVSPPYVPKIWNDPKKPEIQFSHNCYTYMLNDLSKTKRVNGKPQPGYFEKYMNKIKSSNKFNIEGITCKDIRLGVKQDNPHLTVLSLKKGQQHIPPPYKYKGFMMVSPDRDYHFARQDNRLIPVYRAIHNLVKRNKLILPKSPMKLAYLFIAFAEKIAPDIVDLAKQLYPKNMTSGNPIDYLRGIRKSASCWSHKPGSGKITDKDASGHHIINPELANWNYSSKGGINYSIMCCYFLIPSNHIQYTYSTGIDAGNGTHDDPFNIRYDVSADSNIDEFYERLVRKALRGKHNSFMKKTSLQHH